MENFNIAYSRFLETYWSPEFVFLARPNQTLEQHINGMLQECIRYLKQREFFQEYNQGRIIYWGSVIAIICHDFGKIHPHFQYKIARLSKKNEYPPIPRLEKSLSYHTLTSAVFTKCFIKKFSNRFPQIGIPKDLLVAVSAVANHHAKVFSKELEPLIRPFRDNEQLQKKMFEPYANLSFEKISSIFHLSVETIFCTLGILPKEGENYLKEAFDDFKKKYASADREDVISRLYNLIDLLDDFDLKNNTIPGEYYQTVLFVASLLCDLDIWNARFFSQAVPEIPFQTKFFPKFDGIADIVKNYVSDPFGKLDENFTVFRAVKPENVMDALRNELFQVIDQMEFRLGKIYFLDAPTGAGKTLALLNAAYKLNQLSYKKYGRTRRIIYALPFVSIGTQVANQVLKLFGEEKLVNNPYLVVDDYLTENFWTFDDHNSEKKIFRGQDAKWLISSWQSMFIVTTFVKLFHALLKPKKANYLKIHRIAGSIIILDEVQCIPVKYWDVVAFTLLGLTKLFGCTILLSTATLPRLFEDQKIGIPLSTGLLDRQLDPKIATGTLKENLNRYRINFIFKELSIDDFIRLVKNYLKANKSQHILVVLNTRGSAYRVFRSLLDGKKEINIDKNNLYLLSTLVTPMDRRRSIKEIHKKTNSGVKKNGIARIVVVSTQVIEAGVDLSFGVVFRDIAPVDSLVQVAGRCNRHYTIPTGGDVYVFKIYPNDPTKLYYHQVYKQAPLSLTTNFLSKSAKKIVHNIMGEVFCKSEPTVRQDFGSYFDEIHRNKYTKLCCQELIEADFFGLKENFEMIEEYANRVPLLVGDSEEAVKLFEKVKNSGNLSTDFFLYSISVNNKFVQGRSENIIKLSTSGNEFKEGDETLFFYLTPEGCKKYYRKRSGLIIVDSD